MEEDLEGYMNWLTHADDIEAVRQAEGGGASLKVDVGKHKGDPVVMGLLKSTMFPLQQVLEGKVGPAGAVAQITYLQIISQKSNPTVFHCIFKICVHKNSFF